MKRAGVLMVAVLGGLALAGESKLADAQVDAAFAKADLDKDGKISLSEAVKFGIRERYFKLANPDKDGSLDKSEFAAAVEAQFNAANPDKDGSLDRKEAKRAGVKSLKTFNAANSDNDETLELSEYLDALIRQAR